MTLDYTTAHNTTAHYTTLHFTTLHYIIHITLHSLHHTATTTATTLHYNDNSTTLQLVHHTTSSSCGWGDYCNHCNHCNHSKQHNSNHLSVHQWIRSAIHASQQLTCPIVSYLWNLCHRLVRYYWYIWSLKSESLIWLTNYIKLQ